MDLGIDLDFLAIFEEVRSDAEWRVRILREAPRQVAVADEARRDGNMVEVVQELLGRQQILFERAAGRAVDDEEALPTAGNGPKRLQELDRFCIQLFLSPERRGLRIVVEPFKVHLAEHRHVM